jgi:hypothetical protein
MTEPEKVWRNLNGDVAGIAKYIVARCGDFVYDRERAAFIAEFLAVAALRASPEPQEERLRELARIEARRRHNMASDIAGFGASSGHADQFKECTHEDCKLVRSGASSSAATPDKS